MVYRRDPNRIPNGYEKEAFEAAKSGKFLTFESWEYWFYTCRDCGQSTKGQVIHRCQRHHTVETTNAG
jgi:hypothetical protein